jgi:hypothetical protein
MVARLRRSGEVRIGRMKNKNKDTRKIFTLSIQRGGYLEVKKNNSACRDGDGEL